MLSREPERVYRPWLAYGDLYVVICERASRPEVVTLAERLWYFEKGDESNMSRAELCN
jgi:hypothetical protein